MSLAPRPRPANDAVARHPAAGRVAFGVFQYDRRDRRLERDGVEIELPPRALAVLDVLLDRVGKVVSKQSLVEQVWNGAYVADASITEAISLLRQALGDSHQQPAFIRTVHRRGYRFIAEVRPVQPERPAEPRAVEVPSPPDEPARAHAASSPRPAPWLATLLIATLAVHGLLLWLGGRAGDEPAAGASAQGITAQPATTRPVVQFLQTVSAPEQLDRFRPVVALSPDGSQLVWRSGNGDDDVLMYRDLARLEARPLASTEGALTPFFSPDGRWIGYFAQRKLWKLDPAGGQPVALCDTAYGIGASWGEDGTIVFPPHPGTALLRVDEAGGEPELVADADPSVGEVALFWPRHLPGGDVLITSWSNTVASASIVRLDPSTGARRTLVRGAAGAHWLPPATGDGPGELIFARPDGIVAASFDPGTNQVGSPAPVLGDLMADPFTGMMQLAVAAGGTLAYLPRDPQRGRAQMGERRLVRLDGDGHVEQLATPPRLFRNLEVSPDGLHAAVTVAEGDSSDVYVANLASGSLRRLSFEGFDIEPVWTPDGLWVTFASDRSGHYGIYRKRADGTGGAELLFEQPHHTYPWAWLPDGSGLIYAEARPDTGWDLWLWHTDGTKRPLFATDALESGASPSPDGELLAVEVAVDGDWQIYLYDFPDLASRWQISTDGGWHPTWSPDGRSLYFHGFDGFYQVSVRRDGRILPEAPHRLLGDDLGLDLIQRAGDDFVAIQEQPIEPADGIHVVLGWRPGFP